MSQLKLGTQLQNTRCTHCTITKCNFYLPGFFTNMEAGIQRILLFNVRGVFSLPPTMKICFCPPHSSNCFEKSILVCVKSSLLCQTGGYSPRKRSLGYRTSSTIIWTIIYITLPIQLVFHNIQKDMENSTFRFLLNL